MLSRPRLSDFLGALFSAALLFGKLPLFGDPGLGWHLRSGEWIFAHRALPPADPFLLAGSAPRPWIHDQWLSDLLFWQLYALGGPGILRIAVAVCCVGSLVFIQAPLLRRYSDSAVSVFFLLFLSAMMSSLQWFVRPVILSFVFFACAVSLAYRIRESRTSLPRSAYFLPLFFLLWVNLHPAFILGLFVLAVAVVLRRFTGRTGERTAQGQLILECLLLLSAAATMVNPWGPALYRSILGLGNEPFFMHLNEEWFSPNLQQLSFAALPVLLCLFLLLQGRNQRQTWDLLDGTLFTVFLFLALLHRRYLPFFAVACIVPSIKLLTSGARRKTETPLAIALNNISSREQDSPSGTWTIATWLAAAVVLLVPLSPLHLPDFQRQSLNGSIPEAFLEILSRAETAPIFHSPDLGGSLTWSLWPHQRAWIDDRNQLLSREPYQRWLQVSLVRPGWDEILARERFHWALLPTDSPLALVLMQDPAWNFVAGSRTAGLQLFEKAGES
jgi:hypothetical protein